MKVTVGLVLAHGFPVPDAFVESWTGVMEALLTGSGNAILRPERRVDAVRVMFERNFPVDWARNHVCTAFLDSDDGDYLLFLDCDMTHPPHVAHRLLRHDVDVVTGRYFTRRAPFWTVAMRRVGPGTNEYQTLDKLLPRAQIKGLLPVDAGGAGALLVARRVLVAMRRRLGADDWFRYQDGEAGLRCRSEDMWFYEQAIAAGFQPYLDADVLCGHVTQTLVDARTHDLFVDAVEEKLGRELAGAALAPGTERRDVGLH